MTNAAPAATASRLQSGRAAGAGSEFDLVPSLKASFVTTSVGNFVYGACQWGILVVIARLGQPSQVGLFALSFALSAPAIVLGNLQLRTFHATDAAGEYEFADYLGLRLATAGFAVVFVTVLVVALGYGTDTIVVVVLIAVAKAAEAVSDVIYGLLQHREQLRRIAVSLIAKGVLSLFAVWVAIATTHDLRVVAGALAVTWAAMLCLYDLPVASRALAGRPGHPPRAEVTPHWLRFPAARWRPRELGVLVRAALPLGVASLLESLRQNAPRYFIDAMIGRGALGLFAASAYVATIGGRVVVSLGQSASARLARYAISGQPTDLVRLVRRLALVAVFTGLPGIIVALVAGRSVLTAFYGARYASQGTLFALIMLAAGFDYVAKMLQFVLIGLRQTKTQLALDGMALTCIVVLSVLAIPRYGLIGAAIAMVVASGLQAAAASVATMLATSKVSRSSVAKSGAQL